MNRLIPGLFLAACWLLLLLYGSFPVFAGVLFLIIGIAALEYKKMAFSGQEGLFRVFFLFLVLLPVLFCIVRPSFGSSGGLFFSFLLLTGYLLFHYNDLHEPFSFFERAFWGVAYIGFLGSHVLLLYQLPAGNHWIMVLTAITAGSDSGAYYFGRAMGKRKLCPSISPNKTVEGAVGGLVTGVIVASLMALMLRMPVDFFFVITAIVLTGVGVVGDLTESIVKRATGTKDSGTLLGGHGGVLDRADSLLFAAPLLYYILVWYQGLCVVPLP
jgi:phosphatidate cytidylyltransferase